MLSGGHATNCTTTKVRVALDTNVIAYAQGVDSVSQRDAALALLARLPRQSIVLPVQVLGELFNVLIRKTRLSRADAHSAVTEWRESVSLIETSPAVMKAALELAADHNLGIWDAVVLAAAAQGGCRLLLSEDMHDGFDWNGVTIANPFAASPHPLLQALLR